MVESFYLKFGLPGSILVSFVIFSIFILWLAGVAGITQPLDGGRPRGKVWQLVVSVLFPPYPLAWMISKIVEQRKFLKKIKMN